MRWLLEAEELWGLSSRQQTLVTAIQGELGGLGGAWGCKRVSSLQNGAEVEAFFGLPRKSKAGFCVGKMMRRWTRWSKPHGQNPFVRVEKAFSNRI